MKIYTKTGDKGTTSLLGGTRVPKYHGRIDAYGTVDELNSWMGLLRDQPETAEAKALLLEIQEKLFTIGSNLAAEKGNKFQIPKIEEEAIQKLEAAMDKMDEQLPPMKNFVLPGGHQVVSYAHIARCVCRRAERAVVGLHEQEPVEEILMIYLNRLSDYLFVFSRFMALKLKAEEKPWKPKR